MREHTLIKRLFRLNRAEVGIEPEIHGFCSVRFRSTSSEPSVPNHLITDRPRERSRADTVDRLPKARTGLWGPEGLTGALGLHGVPDVAVEVVVAGQQQAPRLGEGHRGDAADDVVVRVHGQLLVRPHVKQAARRVVRPRRKRIPVGEELQREGGASQTPGMAPRGVDDFPRSISPCDESRRKLRGIPANPAPQTNYATTVLSRDA